MDSKATLEYIYYLEIKSVNPFFLTMTLSRNKTTCVNFVVISLHLQANHYTSQGGGGGEGGVGLLILAQTTILTPPLPPIQWWIRPKTETRHFFHLWTGGGVVLIYLKCPRLYLGFLCDNTKGVTNYSVICQHICRDISWVSDAVTRVTVWR